MAAATTVLAASATALSLGKGVHDIVSGSKRARKAEESLKNYERQDLTNVYAGMSVPTRGAQLQTEGAYQTQAETAQLASQSGARGAIGGSQTIAENTRQAMERIGANLQESELRLQQMFAEDEARIRGIQEQREQQDIAGLGAERATAEARKDAGWDTMVSTASSAAQLAHSGFGQDGGGSGIETQGGSRTGYTPKPLEPRGFQTTEVKPPRTLNYQY